MGINNIAFCIDGSIKNESAEKIINDLKTDTMFLLEPVNNISQNLQARARIVRLNSHPQNSSVEIITS